MKTIIISLKIFLLFTLLTGVVYPLLITGIAQSLFPEKANGSIIVKGNKKIGSKLIGQQFDSPFYFSSRPSSISYNPLPSGGSNSGLTNGKLVKLVKDRSEQFILFNQLDSMSMIPAEMVFASASGLDPHISPEAALLQTDRVSLARHFNNSQKERLLQCINRLIEKPQFFCLGEDRINVLTLNIELDKLVE
jgi:K+-transporting ATPase ATPase C chain